MNEGKWKIYSVFHIELQFQFANSMNSRAHSPITHSAASARTRMPLDRELTTMMENAK